MELFQNSQKFRVRYGSLAELTKVLKKVPGRYMNAVPVPAPGYVENGIPVPRVQCHGRTEVTEIPGVGVNVMHFLQKFRYG